MTEYHYVSLYGPVGWTRAKPNFDKRKIYDGQKDMKLVIGLELKRQCRHLPLEGPIILKAIFYMPIPPSFSQQKRETMVGQPHLKAPDASNLLKFYEDVMVDAGIIVDDRLLFNEHIVKIYDRVPRVEITLIPFEGK